MRQVLIPHHSAPCLGAKLAFILTCATALTDSACAQGSEESRSVHLRNECRLAAQTLHTGHPAPKTDWALSSISFCDESGGPTLQALWASPSTDSAALEQLVVASSRLLDQRVYEAVRAAARDAGLARAVRLAALRVLGAFIDNRTLIVPDHFLKPNPDTSLLIRFAKVSGGIAQTVGSHPLPTNASGEIRALFAELARIDTDPVIRRAGRSLQDWFIAR